MVPEAEKTQQYSARPSLTAGRHSSSLGTAPVAVKSEQLPSARDSSTSGRNAGSLYDSMAMRYQSQQPRVGSQQDIWDSSTSAAKEENKSDMASADLSSAAAASLAEYKQKLLGRNSSSTDIRGSGQQSSRVSARHPPTSLTGGAAMDSLRSKWAAPRGETRPESGSQCSTRESSSATLITPTSVTAAPLTSRRPSAELPVPSLIGSARQDGGEASNALNLDDLAAPHVEKIGQDIGRRPWTREVVASDSKKASLQVPSYYPGAERDAAAEPPLPHLLRQRSRHAEYQDDRSLKPGSLLSRRSGNEGEYEASKFIDRPLGERMRLQQHRTHREALVEGRDSAREYNSNKPSWLSDALPSRSSRRDGLVEDLGAPQKLVTTQSTTPRTKEQDAERNGITTSRSLTRLRDPISARASSQTLADGSNHRSRALTSRPTGEGELEFAKCESYSSRQNVHVGNVGMQRSSLLTSGVTHSDMRSQPQSARTAAVERSTSRSALGAAKPDKVTAGELPPPQRAPRELEVSAPSPRLFLNSQKKFLQDLADAEQHWKNLQSTFNEALGLGTTSTAQPTAVPVGGSWTASAGGGRRW